MDSESFFENELNVDVNGDPSLAQKIDGNGDPSLAHVLQKMNVNGDPSLAHVFSKIGEMGTKLTRQQKCAR